ncbi:DNA polymerase-3 subunit gamma/tau [Marmoricola sp. OAE513]|uniref:DNA polymerase III subunit gamma and tau n=1 Tax=Marmoricola sp. OAE513 TaxID=2817894 RepID=UPI001AE1B3D7
MEHNLALYRRYRPESFAEVIGQDHVTDPLRSALANNRVNHAYLFSGPRGCGKTTSARILARALNCEKAPISDPCGECQSCRDLARGGPGSLDVIEIDAASHGGVDDARDLRERAFFAPVSSRYKVYIIDEAHMVTTQGFNALLKLVEEPPEHLKFIFATTEPEKVIPTIRSRTHHYPFRLIPPRVLSDYLAEICSREGVPIEPAALPLVVRAGAGSARDSLSVLDQLLGGAGPAGLTYDVAAGLLGYTPDALLDQVVDAFSAGDGRTVFSVVDKVIEIGQDPRRFTEDLLRRLRDLVIVAAVPDAPTTGLLDVPDDQAERLVAQAARFGRADLVRAADCVAAGLTEMRGATTPRLLLELICARVLLPGADHSTDGLTARLDRMEKRLEIGGVVSTPAPAAAPAAPAPVPAAPAAEPAPVAERPVAPAPPVSQPPSPVVHFDELSTAPPSEGASPIHGSEAASTSAPELAAEAAVPAPPAPAAPAAPPAPAASAAPAASSGGLGLADARRLWPDLLDKVKEMRRFTWILLSQNAQVIGLDGGILTVGFKNAGAKDSFVGGGSEEILRQAAIDVIGADWRVEAIVDPSADPDAGGPVVTRAATEPTAEVPRLVPVADVPAEPPAPEAGSRPPAWIEEAAAPQAPTRPVAAAPQPETIAAVRSNISPTRTGEQPDKPVDTRDDDVSADDENIDEVGNDSTELLINGLGATVIDEIPHD